MELREAVRAKEALDTRFFGDSVLTWIFFCEGRAALIVETTVIRPDVLVTLEEIDFNYDKMASTTETVWPFAMVFR